MPHSGDMEMWLRMAAICDVGYVKGADQAYYRVHTSSMQRTVHAGPLFDLKGRLEAFQSAFEKETGLLPDAQALHDRAKCTLARISLRHASRLCKLGLETSEPLDEFCAFAIDICPGIHHTHRWRSLQKSLRDDGGSARTALARVLARAQDVARRELFDRIEWRWARRTGVYFPR